MTMEPTQRVIQIEDTGVTATLTFGNETMEVWDLFTFMWHQRKVGQLVLSKQLFNGEPVWVVVNTYVTIREIGLMRRFIKLLGYPRMCSCFGGATSEDCYDMWRALGAVKTDTQWSPVGFVYFLKQ